MRNATAARLTMGVCVAALALTSCNKEAPSASQQAASSSGQPVTAPPIAALPLATAAPTAPVAVAPAVAALPAATHAIRVVSGPRVQRYRYADRAYAMSQAFGESPPDYTVDYQGTRPWIWRADNGGYRVIERLPGGQRVYYYEPGATQPFYVSDPDYGYAFDGDELVGLYSPDGVPIDDVYARQRADAAARYLDRARALFHAAQYEQRQAAYAADWHARHTAVIQQQQAWDAARAHDDEWQAWHDAHQDGERQAWQAEQTRRTAYAAAIGVGVGLAAGAILTHRQGPDTGQAPYAEHAPPSVGGIMPGRAGPLPTLATARPVALQPQSSLAQRRQAVSAPVTRPPTPARQAAPLAVVAHSPVAVQPRPDPNRPGVARLAAQEQAGQVQARTAQADAERLAAQKRAYPQHAQLVGAAHEEAKAAGEAQRQRVELAPVPNVAATQAIPHAKRPNNNAGHPRPAFPPPERQALPAPHPAQAARKAQPSPPRSHPTAEHKHSEPGPR